VCAAVVGPDAALAGGERQALLPSQLSEEIHTVRTFLRAAALVAAVALTVTACRAASGSGTVSDDDGNCYEYSYDDVTPPTAPTTVPVNVAPCDGNPAPEGKNVLFLGSSTTGCTGPSDLDHCYVKLVEKERTADHFTVVGRGGTYVAYGTPSQNWTQTTIPSGMDTVIIQLGINDWYVPVAPSTFRSQLDEFLGRVRTANPDADIHWIRTWMPTPTGDADTRRSMWVQHGYVTADAVEAVHGFFHDMPGTPAPRDIDSTGWHYNDQAHAELADVVLSFL
jgi:hypothetical protein